MSEYNEKASELWDALMGIEMQLVDQLEVWRQPLKVPPLFEFSIRLISDSFHGKISLSTIHCDMLVHLYKCVILFWWK